MLTFIQFVTESILLENRIDFLKQKNPTIDTSHDRLAQHKDASDIIDHFATNADPTPNKSHTQWILNQYKKKDFRQEDHPRIHEALSNFDKHKSKLDKKDINQYKSLSQVEDAIEPHLGTVSNKEQKRIVKHEGAELIHDSPTLSVHKLKTKEAACHYGAGTKWCTAAKKHNMFDYYNKEGPLYVIQHKDTGEKHQYHFESDQFMNEKDHPLDLTKEVEKHPDLKNVKEFKNSLHGVYFAKDKDEFNHLMNKALDDEHWPLRKAAIMHPKATPDHISKALDDKDYTIREAAIEHPQATPEHISKALKDNYWNVRYAAIEHSKATPDHISKALNDKDHAVRYAAINHPKATPEHINKALDDENWKVRLAAIQHSKVTPEHISKALSDEDYTIRKAAIMHSKVTPDHISKALSDEDYTIREAAIQHPEVTPEHISKALNDEDTNVRYAAIRHPNANPEHISKALKDNYWNVREAAIQHPKATPEHITKALNDKDIDVRHAALRHPKVNPEHIDKALNDEDYTIREAAIQHPKATPEHITKALNDEDIDVRHAAKEKHAKL